MNVPTQRNFIYRLIKSVSHIFIHTHNFHSRNIYGALKFSFRFWHEIILQVYNFRNLFDQFAD